MTMGPRSNIKIGRSVMISNETAVHQWHEIQNDVEVSTIGHHAAFKNEQNQ